MAQQVKSITSESLEAAYRGLIPSQDGFTEDLMASNTIIPVLDLTSSAEGTSTPSYLTRAWDDSTGYTNVVNTTETLITNTGFWQVDLDLDVAIVRDVPDASELPIAYIWLDQAELQGFSDKVSQGQIEAISEFNLKVLNPTALEMQIVDPLGRTTRFELNIESTDEPEPSLFQPNIPGGADFFDERTRPLPMIGRGIQ